MDELIRRVRVVAAAREWFGTPYHHMVDVKGAGCDCAMPLALVCRDLGLLDPLAMAAGLATSYPGARGVPAVSADDKTERANSDRDATSRSQQPEFRVDNFVMSRDAPAKTISAADALAAVRAVIARLGVPDVSGSPDQEQRADQPHSRDGGDDAG